MGIAWRAVAVAATLGAGAPSGALADSYVPYGTTRFVAEGGRHYVVVTPTKHGVVLEPGFRGPRGEYLWVERAKDAAPLEPTGDGGKRGGHFAPEAGDRVLRRGTLADLPTVVVVSPRGGGFAGMEEWAHSGRGVSLALVPAEGPAFEHRLEGLLTEDERRTLRDWTHGKQWLRVAWWDDEAKEVVVVAWPHAAKAVSAETGAVRSVPLEDLEARLDRSSDPRILDVLRALRHRPDPERLRGIAGRTRDGAAAIRATAMLAEAGDDEARARLVETAKRRWEGESAPPEIQFALESLPRVLRSDEEVLAVLRAVALGQGHAALGPVMGALDEMLRRGRSEAVISLLERRTEPVLLRQAAVFALRDEPDATHAVPALLRVAASDPDLAVISLAAAEMLLPYGVAPSLPDFLGRSPVLDASVAFLLSDLPWSETVPGLVDALARRPEGDLGRLTVLEALRFQTGRDFGSDVAAWRAWLAKRPPRRASAWRVAVRRAEEPVHVPAPLGGQRTAVVGLVLRSRAAVAEGAEREERGETREAVEALEQALFLWKASPYDLSETLAAERLDLARLDDHVRTLRASARGR